MSCNCPWQVRVPSAGSCVLVTYLHFFFCLLVLSYFLHQRCSSCNLPSVGSAISPRDPGSLWWGAKTCMLGVTCGVLTSKFELSDMVDTSYMWLFTFKMKWISSPQLHYPHFKVISYRWLEATILDSANIGHFCYHVEFFWTALFLDPFSASDEFVLTLILIHRVLLILPYSMFVSPWLQKHQYIYILFAPTVHIE